MATRNQTDVGLSGASGTGSFAGTTSPTITTPIISQINDTNSAAMLGMNTVGSAVNYLGIFNNGTGAPPVLICQGTDTNINMQLTTKGAGSFVMQTTLSASAILLQSGTGFQHTTNFSFSNTAANRTVTYPDADGTVTLLGNTGTGTGSVVLATSPTLVTPVLGVATGTSFNTITGVATQAEQETATSIVQAVTPGRQQYHPSAAKAWVECGITANILASYNTSSIGDGGTGIVTFNFTTAFSSTYYSAMGTAAGGSTVARIVMTTSYAVGSVVMNCVDGLGNLAEPAGSLTWNLAVFGDQ